MRLDHEKINCKKKVAIMIVDDHPIVRFGVAQILNQQDDMQLCCEASNAEEALAAMQIFRPDLVIVDISLQGASGLNLLTTLLTLYPGLPILVMSMHEEAMYAERALRMGAKGYIMKHQATYHIKSAIRAILNGEVYLSEEMQNLNLHSKRILAEQSGSVDPVAMLTLREYEIFRLIGFGLGTRQIAKQLGRSVKTIESHRINIKTKLSFSTNLELIRQATFWVESNC